MSFEAPAFAGLWPWEPITPRNVTELLRGLPVPWWIAGGCAIELFLGRETRRHFDLDIAILRRDQLALRRHLADWDFCVATPERRLYRWNGSTLELPITRLWVRPRPGASWWVDGRLQEARSDHWFYGQDDRVSMPLTRFGQTTDAGVPYVAPEIALFYMLISPTPKAKADFLASRPQLSPASREWLRRAVELVDRMHPVLPLL